MAMIYRVPCPTRTNGVKLLKMGDQIAVEYQTGEPHVGGMAFDSALGSMARNVTIRPKRPDLDRIIRDARRKVYGHDVLPRAGVPPLTEDDNVDNSDAMGKVLEFLEPIISPDDLEVVQALLSGAADVEEAREQQALAARELDRDRRSPRQATDRRLAVAAQRRQMGRHGMSAELEQAYAEMFPDWNRLA